MCSSKEFATMIEISPISDLPDWLKNFLLSDLGAKNDPDWSKAMNNLSNTHSDNRIYLGTYFPRTFLEIDFIMCKLSNETNINEINDFGQNHSISILSVGCGTGGDVSGLIFHLNQNYKISEFTVTLVDGNTDALALCCTILKKLEEMQKITIKIIQTVSKAITTAEDFSMIASKYCIGNAYDFIITSKFLNEIINQVKTPYSGFVTEFSPFLGDKGLMIIIDTSNSIKPQEWIPEIMNNDFNENINNQCSVATILPVSCCGDNCTFHNCYTQFQNKGSSLNYCKNSKFTFRVFSKRKLFDSIRFKNFEKNSYIINYAKNTTCPRM